MSNQRAPEIKQPWDNAGPMAAEKLEAWRLPQEEAILQRVKQRLHQEHFTPKTARRPWSWLLLPTSAVALTALLLVLWQPWLSGSPDGLALKVRGAVQPLHTRQVVKSQKLSFQALTQKPGHFSVKDRWEMQTQGQTRLTLTPPRQEQYVQLHRGFIQVHVHPGQMKSFVVQARSWKVTVLGTKFTVERTANWLRLEVWRGKVSLMRESQAPEYCQFGKGIRVDLRTGALLRYRLPPQHLRQPEQRWKWMEQQNQTALLLQYISDVAQSQRYTLQQRQEWLSAAANWAYRHRYYRAEYRLFLQAYQIQNIEASRAQHLFSAAKACERAFSMTAKRCAQLFQKYISLYPSMDPESLARSHYGVVAHQIVTAPDEQQALQHLRRYLRHTPKSYYTRKLRGLLTQQQQFAWTPFCQWLRSVIPGRAYQPWMKQGCR